MNINYNQWIHGPGGCGCGHNILIDDACDCESITLELSKQHTDDLVLQDEIDALSGHLSTFASDLDALKDKDEELLGLIENKASEDDLNTLEEIVKNISGGTDLTNYYTKQEIDDKLDDKQDNLISGVNIKTINNQSLLGQGNINVEGKDADLSNYYTKNEVDNLIPTVPSNVSAFNNDAGYLTQHQPLKTINGQVISGSGNIVIEGSVTVDNALSLTSTNPAQNKVITEALNGKPEASTVYTKTEVNNLLSVKANVWCGTLSEYNSIGTKDNNTIYLIHE